MNNNHNMKYNHNKNDKMYLPDYNGGSIVNLMSSIEKSLGGKPRYKQLKLLGSEELAKSNNIVLLVVDGFGYEYLMKNLSKTIFYEHLKGSITSVFPSTTASAITTFQTGLAPQQHAVTGWFMHLKEIGMVCTILPFVTRCGKGSLTSLGFTPGDILNLSPFSNRIKVSSYIITPKNLADEHFNQAVKGKSRVLGYNTTTELCGSIRKVIRFHKRKKFIYAYTPFFDTYLHHEGTASTKARRYVNELEKALKKMMNSLKGTKTTIIITADHGLIDTPRSKLIRVEKHPELKETLTLPLCGESRAAYCYVHPSKAKYFESYVHCKLGKYCIAFKSEELVKKNYFGPFKPNPNLHQRIGDYVIIFKKDYAINDLLLNETRKEFLARHGGVSREEMLVPLIVMKSK